MTVKDTVGDPDIYQYEDDENEEESREVEMKLMGDIDSMSRTTERRLLDGKQEDKEVKPEKKRDSWSNKTEFLLACVGYAVWDWAMFGAFHGLCRKTEAVCPTFEFLIGTKFSCFKPAS